MTVRVVASAAIEKGREMDWPKDLVSFHRPLKFSSMTRACASLCNTMGPGDSKAILLPEPRRDDDPAWRERGRWCLYLPKDPTDESDERDMTLYLLEEI